MRGVDGLECFAHCLVAGDVAVDFAASVLVRGADEQIARPRAGVRECIGLVDHDVLKSAIAEGVAFFYGVEPADHALATSAGAEFDLLELNGERVCVAHLREEGVGADFGVVGFGNAEGVDALHRDAGALEELGGVSVRGSDVGREAVALIEPVGLAKLADDGAAGMELAKNQLADFADVGRKGYACGPGNLREGFEVERERRCAAEAREIKFFFVENPEFDPFSIRAELGGGEFVEETSEGFGADAADVLDDTEGTVGALGEFARKEVGASKEIRECHLPLADFVGVSGRDAAASRSAGFFGEDLFAIIFPSKIEEAMREVGDHCALVDQ